MSVPSSKPLVLISCTPIYGHLMPIRAIGKELVTRGYEVTFVTGSAYQKPIEATGASLVPLEGYGDYTEAEMDTKWPIRNTLPAGPVQLAFDMEHFFINTIPSQYHAIQKALKLLNEQHPGRPIVLLNEFGFFGSLPLFAGAPGLRPTAQIGIGIIPVVLSSIDVAPAGLGLLPDTSPEGREKYKAMTKMVQEQMLGQAQKRFAEIFTEVGANDPGMFFLDAGYILHDRFLQMCIPSVEYSRSDAPDSIRFAGGLPKGHRDPFTDQPAWWDEIVNNKTKKIVAVSQGTLAMNFSDLIIPTMTALAEREDILVVVALGKKGAALPAGTTIPANSRVTDFIPFDDLLPHCSLFITNGGYGAFQHAISNGTPLIVAGTTEDKPEVAARAEWCGAGINLRTAKPSPEVLLSSVLEMITNPKYQNRAVELEKEMATYDPMSIVAQSIDELGASKV